MACLGSPMRTSVRCPLNAASMTFHWTGSVSWNSSTITTDQRRRIRCRAGASGPRARRPAGSAGRRSRGCRAGACDAPSPRARHARSRPGPPRPTPRRTPAGPAGVRVADHLGGELERGRAGERGRVRGAAEAQQVEVVDDLGHQLAQVVDQGRRRRRCRPRRRASAAPAGRTGGWWRWSRRRSRPARPAAGRGPPRASGRRTRCPSRPVVVAPGPGVGEGALGARPAGRGPARAAPGWRPGRT